MLKKISENPFVHVAVIFILVLLAYSNSFTVPFQYDDDAVIKGNQIVKDLRNFIDPSRAESFRGHFEYHTFRSRYIGYLTLALNYKIHGLHVTGYHIVNFLIHFGAALLLYLLVVLSFRTPFLEKSRLKESSRGIAFFTALLFACHPLQTEAVTYIWQRVASLAGMLYILSLVLYVRWRLTIKDYHVFTLRSLVIYIPAIVSVVMAMKTKQTAFTLPVVIALYEIMFFDGKMKRRLIGLVPFFLTLPIIPLTLLDIDQPIGNVIGDVSSITRDFTDMSRLDYLFTQFTVITKYIWLFFLPVNQNLNHGYTIYTSLLHVNVLASFLILLAVFSLSVYLLYVSGHSAKYERLIAFGILWFFITLTVESSLIPIAEIICEYRMYLPSVGLCIAVITFYFSFVNKMSGQWKWVEKTSLLILFIIAAVLAGATYARNEVWQDRVTLWEDVVKKSPDLARGHVNLGAAYEDKGLIEKAVRQYETAIINDPGHVEANYNLGAIYLSRGLFNKAAAHLEKAIANRYFFADAHYNLGIAYRSTGQTYKAIESFKTSIRIEPDHSDVHMQLGATYLALDIVDNAIKHLETATRLDPRSFMAKAYLEKAYKKRNQRN